MAKRNENTTTVETVEIWEYEYKDSDGGSVWLREDDERSASYKATGNRATGNIRSKTEVITTVSTPWTVKEQTLVAPENGYGAR
jgi:hypothetical protein